MWLYFNYPQPKQTFPKNYKLKGSFVIAHLTSTNTPSFCSIRKSDNKQAVSSKCAAPVRYSV